MTNGGTGYSGASHTTVSTTAANAAPTAQMITTLSDCYTNAELSVTNLHTSTSNVTYVCSQYDDLGRVVETAVPGDTLSSLPQVGVGQTTAYSSYTWPPTHFVRDTSANCATNAGTTIGDGGAGPTKWNLHLSLGTINQQRTFMHNKDGTASGIYAAIFTDAAGHTIEAVHEVDPTTTAGAGTSDEIC